MLCFTLIAIIMQKRLGILKVLRVANISGLDSVTDTRSSIYFTDLWSSIPHRIFLMKYFRKS